MGCRWDVPAYLEWFRAARILGVSVEDRSVPRCLEECRLGVREHQETEESVTDSQPSEERHHPRFQEADHRARSDVP